MHTYAENPVVYEQGLRRDLTDAEYRKWLAAEGFLGTAGQPQGWYPAPSLRLDDAGRLAVEEHLRQGANGQVEMAIPLDQVPDYVLMYWGYDVMAAA